jgi:hypothetical protein
LFAAINFALKLAGLDPSLHIDLPAFLQVLVASERDLPKTTVSGRSLRRCAMSLGKTSTSLGAFYRRPAVRIGKAKALTAALANSRC